MRPAALSILGLFLLLPTAFAEPPSPRPRFDIEAAFNDHVDRLCKEAKPDVEYLTKMKDDRANAEFMRVFKACLDYRPILRHPRICGGPVAEEHRAVHYGAMAGGAAVEASQAAAYTEVCKALRERKDKPYIKGGASMLHMAVRLNDAEGLRLLLKAGIAPDLLGEAGATALSEAIGRRRLPLVKILLEHRASVYQATSIYRETPLAAAIQYPTEQALELVELLLARGADVEGLNLNCIAEPRLLAMLIKAGADVTATNGDGYTALHFAGSEEIARLLLDAGADINAVANDGLTPMDNLEDQKVIQFLRARGGMAIQSSIKRDNAYRKLDEPLPVNFEENKLIDILSYYRNTTGLPMCVDWRSLKAAGIKENALITLKPDEQMSAQDSLRLALGQVSFKLVFDVDSAGMVLIGTPDSVRLIAAHPDALRAFYDPKARPERLAAMKRMIESQAFRDIDYDLEDRSLSVVEAVTYVASIAGPAPRIDWPALEKASLDLKHKVELFAGHLNPPCLVLNYLLAQGGATSWAVRVSEAGEVVISTETEIDAFMKSTAK